MGFRPKSLLLLTALTALSDGSVAGDRELGQYLSSECVTCHQASGRVAGGVPQIIGWPEDQFVAVLTSYKAGQREHPVMQAIAGRLSDSDIAALATYFGSLSPKPTSN